MNVLRRAIRSRYSSVIVALIVLVAVSPLLAPGSLAQGAILSMLPFAAILGVASAGQTLIVQQAGIDLSVPGAISLSAMLVNTIAHGVVGAPLILGIVLAVAATVAAGAVAGLAVSWFSVTPLAATLATNGLLLGGVLAISGGSSAIGAPNAVVKFALGRTLWTPNLVLVAVVVLTIVWFVTTRTIYGRRLLTVGISRRAAQAAGVPVTAYTVSAFAAAGACYGIAGVMLAFFLGSPNLFVGTSYLLPTIAAIVVGGVTALGGGRGSVFAAALGALFLTQLDQVISGMGQPTSIQQIVQGAVILVAVSAHAVFRRIRGRQRVTSPQDSEPPGVSEVGSPDITVASHHEK